MKKHTIKIYYYNESESARLGCTGAAGSEMVCFKERMASILKREWQRRKVVYFIFVSLLIIYPKSIVKAFKAISSGHVPLG